MNTYFYLKEIEKAQDIDTLKSIWWTIGMDSNIYGEEVMELLTKVMERYNQIK